jgi:hypothetical protein
LRARSPEKIPEPANEARAAGVDEPLHRRWVAGEQIGRRHRVHIERDDEARALRVELVHLCFIDEAI